MEHRLDKIENSVEILILMAGINMGLLIVTMITATVLLIGWYGTRTMLLSGINTVNNLLLQCVQYFQMIKEMTNITRISQNKIEQAASVVPSIADRVESIPQKTTELVVGAIKAGDSGIHR